MTPERWERVKEIYDSAFHVRSSELPEFLDRACEQDADLRKEVELLLRLDQRQRKQRPVTNRGTLAAAPIHAGFIVSQAAGHTTGWIDAWRTIVASLRNQTPLRIRFVR